MAERFYFQSTGTPNVSPAPDAGWEEIGQLTRINMSQKRNLSIASTLTSSGSITIPITTTQQILCYQAISETVFLPVRLIGVALQVVIRCNENANSNNASLGWSLRAVSADGQRALTSLATDLTGASTEFSTAQQTRLGSGNLGTSTLTEPWRLVFEMGAKVSSPTAAGSFVLRVGCNAASDFAFTSGLTTDLNPWLELAIASAPEWGLNATRLNNYQSVRSTGLATSGAAR